MRKTVDLMEFEVSRGSGLPLLYPGPTGPLDWHRKTMNAAEQSLAPPVIDERTSAAIADKVVEYSQLAGQLMSYKQRSLRSIDIPKKGISYLISENAATQAALAAIADELRQWVSAHKFEPAFLTHSARWGLGEMLAGRPDLLAALRIAQTKPVESEKIVTGIDRPLFVTVTETVIGFIPIVGSAVAAYEAYRGEDLFGYELDTVDRAVLGASVLLPFVGRFIKGGRALYTAERMAKLYGRDAASWSRVISSGERLVAQPGGVKLLRESSDLVRSGKHVGSDIERAKKLETLFKDVGLTEAQAAKGVTSAVAGGAGTKSVSEVLKSLSAKYPILGELALDAPAIDRVLAKGPNASHIKGQLLEELLESKVRSLLGTEAGRAALGVGTLAGRVEFIPGHLIRDAAGRQVTDGILAVREGNKLRVLSVFEAKAGKAAARELALAPGSLADLTRAERSELRAYANDILRDLRDRAAKTGGPPVTKTVEDIEREVILSEKGGQVRRDIERLTTSGKVFIGGVETGIELSPRTTTFRGVLPKDVRSGSIERELAGQGFVFEALKLDVKQSDLAAIAEELENALPSGQGEFSQRCPPGNEQSGGQSRTTAKRHHDYRTSSHSIQGQHLDTNFPPETLVEGLEYTGWPGST